MGQGVSGHRVGSFDPVKGQASRVALAAEYERTGHQPRSDGHPASGYWHSRRRGVAAQESCNHSEIHILFYVHIAGGFSPAT
jgi:hypothetical protein